MRAARSSRLCHTKADRQLSRTYRQAATIAAIAIFFVGIASAGNQILRTNIDADAKTLNPIQNSELYSGDILKHVYESLTTLDVDGNVVPGLATSWATSEDGMSATFTLREGVKFHSGRELTAADVRWTFEQALTPAKKGGLIVDALRSIQGADAMLAGDANSLAGFTQVDKYSFVVAFVRPTVIFPLFEMFIVDSGVEDEHGEDWSRKVSAGTGPFRFDNWQRGVSVSLLAFADYWNGAPKLDGVTFFVVPNIETLLSMYETHELDLVTVLPAAARNVRRDPRFKGQLIEKAAAQVSYLGMNQNLYAPFRDIRVREAISISVDRAAMSYGLFGGAAVPLFGQIAPDFPGYDPSIPEIRYDPDRARELMAQAGYPGGRGLPDLVVQGPHENKTLLAFYADHLKKTLGFPITARIVERGTHLREMNGGNVALFPWAWTADYADPSTFLRDLYHSKSKWNRSRYVNAEFDALIDEAVTTASDAERFALYGQADRVLMKDFGVVPTTVRVQIAIRRPEVTGVELSAMGYMPFVNVKIR